MYNIDYKESKVRRECMWIYVYKLLKANAYMWVYVFKIPQIVNSDYFQEKEFGVRTFYIPFHACVCVCVCVCVFLSFKHWIGGEVKMAEE